MKNYHVYILASKKNGTIYIGVTNNLLRRVTEHKECEMTTVSCHPEFISESIRFTEKYNIKTLVYYEQTENVESAIRREKQLKNWHRQWKINLIEESNPDWKDLYFDLIGMDPETSSG